MSKSIIRPPAGLRDLLAMLTYRRVGGSTAEAAFRERFLLPLGAKADRWGNLWLTVGQGSPILWSSHTDTVHRTAGKQLVLWGAGIASLAPDQPALECLGADCAAGAWLMREMVQASVPGTYVWHAEEEMGGVGSGAVADLSPDRLKGIDYAIALDRRGHRDIIVRQAGGQCASAAFAASVGAILAGAGLPGYEASDRGTFTDTANYTGLVRECTNLSVGYMAEHSKHETLDTDHIQRLRDALCRADWSKLALARTIPLTPDPTLNPAGFDREIDREFSLDRHISPNPAVSAAWVRRYSEDVAAFLADRGYGEDDILEGAYAASRDNFR